MEVITKETRTVLPWSEEEKRFIDWVVAEHPEWDSATVVNQFRYQFPDSKRTDGAIITYIGNFRFSSKRKLKWDEKALKKLARFIKTDTPRAEIAAYFKVTEAALTASIKKAVKLKYMKQTYSRALRSYERATTNKPTIHGIIPETISEVAEQLPLPEVKEEVVMSNTIAASSCNVSAKIIANHKAMAERRSVEQEYILKGIVQVAENISKLMSDTLQMLKGR